MSAHIGQKLFLLYFLILSKIITCEKATSDFNGIKTDITNECQHCKLLTDSLKYWLHKTSRGKFDGGDAAWEEAKLKSYPRSEVRLVEIQEGLCSELKKRQDHCYSIAEKTEKALENWWLHQDPDAVDVYVSFCIENLQYCCPENHFGASCTPCPVDNNDKICGGHGKCDGSGTRTGNGTCKCWVGYTGTHCEKCTSNFYNAATGTCKRCHKACDGCSGEGIADCEACAQGFLMENNVCIDVDECSYPSSCHPNQFCINEEGSHSCEDCYQLCKTCVGAGPTNCTSCDPEAVLWSGRCLNDELKYKLLNETFNREALYLGLLLIFLLVFRFSKLFATYLIPAIAIFIYFSEKLAK